MTERRKHKRVTQILEGTWTGASGSNVCRITDISVGGCFISGLAVPLAGFETTITIKLDKGRYVTAPGKVVYSEANVGFAVEFYPLGEAERARLLAFLAERQARMQPEPRGDDDESEIIH